MNLYSNKQKWKIALLIFALITVIASLLFSNQLVSKVGQREKVRATQWADAIKKKIELVRLTNNTFSKLRDNERKKMELWIDATKKVSEPTPLNQISDYSLPLKIINGNKDIPVILLDQFKNVSGSINLDFEAADLQSGDLSNDELDQLFDDSLVQLATAWETKNPSFTIEVYEGLFMSYFYNDSKEIVRLEAERDSLINAFNNDLINNKALVPVLLVNNQTNEIIGTNITSLNDTTDVLKQMNYFAAENTPISINFENGQSSTLYFGSSPELKQLQYFPYIQFLIIGLFALIGYLIFSTFRKAEQNQVWAGMAKETAHQLGTPLSSLMAWVQLLEAQGTDEMITTEMYKDVERLKKVSERFSKIGSESLLEDVEIINTIKTTIDYLRPRISDKVSIHTSYPEETIESKHNAPLIEWVIENICKNAVDAMEGEGNLTITVEAAPEWLNIDIKDTGKGIPSHQVKTIFQPGFSTKKRGWGLGLSLVSRIVKEYHKGRVYVLESQPNVGTTFRISLPL